MDVCGQIYVDRAYTQIKLEGEHDRELVRKTTLTRDLFTSPKNEFAPRAQGDRVDAAQTIEFVTTSRHSRHHTPTLVPWRSLITRLAPASGWLDIHHRPPYRRSAGKLEAARDAPTVSSGGSEREAKLELCRHREARRVPCAEVRL